MAFGTHFSNSWPYIVDYETAYITIAPDGSVNASTAATDLGTGNNTALAQIAAEAVGAPFESVYLTFGDTESTPFGYGAHSSRSMFAHGNAIVAAAEGARKQIFDYAATLCGRSPGDFELADGILRTKDGEACFPATVRRREIFPGMPASEPAEALVDSVSLTDIAHYAHSDNTCFIGVGQVKLTNTPPWHAVFADVTVDTETGKVTVNKMAAAHDVGRVVHPENLRGQILGGVVQGIGYALAEELGYDPKTGKQTHTTMHHYMVPTALDVPEIDPIYVEEDDPHGPFGAKGAGETSLVCPASAIVNAVSNALGIDFDRIPLTPEHILERLQERKGRE
jgi:Aerobic-type carbon monoxide dehydrogenase, large subunit CoxL/CutL homologs